jgi:hypothetical protein
MPFSPRSAPESEARSVFVSRLERLIQLRRDFQEDLNPLGIELLSRSIYATYRDCVTFGAEDRARTMMTRAGLELEAGPT